MKPLILLLQWPQQHSTVWFNLLFLSAITFTFFFFFKLCSNKAIQNLPPSPPRLPLIGNLHQLGSLPHRSLQALSKKYGPLMLLHFGCVPTIIVSSAEMACEVMKTHDLIFASRPAALSMAKRLLYDCDMTFSPYGEYWRQVRRICVLELLSIKRVESFRLVREEEVSLMIEKISKSCPGFVNLSEMMVVLSNDIISRVALGRKYTGEEGGGYRVHERLIELAVLLGSFPVGDFIPWLSWLDSLSGLNSRVRKNSKELDGFLEGVLEEHLHAKTHASSERKEFNNFVDVLLSLDGKDDTVGISLNRNNMKAIILDMFAAGTDTTFTALEWTMGELIRNPKVMKRVQEEIREFVGHKEKIIEEDLERMNYLKAVIKETLRLHPPVPLLVPREAVEDIQLQGYDIPAGTRVIVNAWTIGRDPKSWDRPEEFYPDRFMNSNIDFKGQDFQLIPFGAGRRGCPGLGFAIAAIEVTLAHLLHHFDWELPNGMNSEALDMSEAPGLTAPRKSSLILVAKPRLP